DRCPAGAEGLAHVAQLVERLHRQSILLRASAGRSRAARAPPTAPAISPPARASAIASASRCASIGASSVTDVEPVATWPWPNAEKGPPPGPPPGPPVAAAAT